MVKGICTNNTGGRGSRRAAGQNGQIDCEPMKPSFAYIRVNDGGRSLDHQEVRPPVTLGLKVELIGGTGILLFGYLHFPRIGFAGKQEFFG